MIYLILSATGIMLIFLWIQYYRTHKKKQEAQAQRNTFDSIYEARRKASNPNYRSPCRPSSRTNTRNTSRSAASDDLFFPSLGDDSPSGSSHDSGSGWSGFGGGSSGGAGAGGSWGDSGGGDSGGSDSGGSDGGSD